jgi:hypothetical protein
MLEWMQTNSAYIIAVLLAISELMALIPALKGNGIIDSVIKMLKAMAAK